MAGELEGVVGGRGPGSGPGRLEMGKGPLRVGDLGIRQVKPGNWEGKSRRPRTNLPLYPISLPEAGRPLRKETVADGLVGRLAAGERWTRNR